MTNPAGTSVPRESRDLGNYQLLAKLATGGMAEIFLARRAGDPAADVVVIKRILPHLAEDQHFVTMFRDEAKLASRIVHDNVCRVHALAEVDRTSFIVMEYLHGVPLSRLLSRTAKARQFLDFRIVAGIIVQACEGLNHAHDLKTPDGQPLGLVHRDVSPPNIFVTTDGKVKLLDFGIAKARGASSKTRTGTVKGKNAYMSPEQILGKDLDRRSDVFALGAVTYELLAIKRLFHRESDFLTFKAITEEAIPDIRERRSDIPAAFRAAVTRALARDPDARFANAVDYAQAVRNAVGPIGGPASPGELALMLRRDFAEEVAARDQILKDAGSAVPGAVSVMSLAANSSGSSLPSLAGSSNSMSMATTAIASPRGRSSATTDGEGALGGEFEAVIDRPRTKAPTVPAVYSELAEPTTDLLGEYRRKSVRAWSIAAGVAAVALAGFVAVVLLGQRDEDSRDRATAAAVPVDAAVAPRPVAPPPDANVDKERDQIIALSRFGFFSVDANAKTAIFIDGARIAEAPITRLPLRPGVHKVKAVGPRNKVKQFDITIFAAQDTDFGTIEW